MGVFVGNVVPEPVADLVEVGHFPLVLGDFERPRELFAPAVDLSLGVAGGPAELAETDLLVVQVVDLRQRVDELFADPLALVRLGEPFGLVLAEDVPSSCSIT